MGQNGFDLQRMVSGVIKTAQAKLAEEDDSEKCDECGATLNEEGDCPKCDYESDESDSGPPAAVEAEKTAAALDYLAHAIHNGQLVRQDDYLSIEKIAQAYNIVRAVESDPRLAFRVKRALAEGIGPNDGGEVVPNDLNDVPGGGGTQQRSTADAPASLQIPLRASTGQGIGPNAGGEALANDLNDVPGGGGSYPEDGIIRKEAGTRRAPMYELSDQQVKQRYAHDKGEMGYRMGRAGAVGGALGAIGGGIGGIKGRAIGALAVGGASAGLSAANSGMKRWGDTREMKRRGISRKDVSTDMKASKQSLKKTAASRILTMGSVMRKLSEEQAPLGEGTVGSSQTGENIPSAGQLSELASSSAAIGYSKADAKGLSTVVDDLAKVLTQPAMDSAYDDVLDKNLSNTDVAKLAGLGDFASRAKNKVVDVAKSYGRAMSTKELRGTQAEIGRIKGLHKEKVMTDSMKDEMLTPLRKQRNQQLGHSAAAYGGTAGVAGAAVGAPVIAHKRKQQNKLASVARRELTERVLSGELHPSILTKLAQAENEQQRRGISFKQSLQEAARIRGEGMNGPASPIEMPGADNSPATSGY